MPTEVDLLGLSAAVWLRLLVVLAGLLFVLRMTRLLGVLQQGRAEHRHDHLARRFTVFVIEVLGQVRVFREPIIGWAHPLVFWGFCLFLVASTLMLLGGMFPTLGVPQVESIPVLGTAVDVFALLVLVGLAASAVRRYALTPPGLQRTTDATIVLLLIAGLMVTFLISEAGSLGHESHAFLPVGGALQWLFIRAGLDDSTIGVLGTVAWWMHVATLLGFLVFLPYSKHGHLLWVVPSVVLSEQPDRGILPLAAADIPDPQRPLSQFTWRMLLNAFTCAECGRCERACPAAASGATLTPRQLMHDFKHFVTEEGLHRERDKGNGAAESPEGSRSLTPIEPAALWACTTCYACMERCPVRNEHVPLIVEMRRKLVEAGELDKGLQDALTALQRYGNSQGKSGRKRFAWAKGLLEPLVDAEKEPVDLLWYVGDYASYHPASARVTAQVARVFQAAGLSFGALTKAEKNSGNDLRRVGEEGLFEMLAEQNVEALRNAQFDRIVTTDPHTYHTLKHEYPRFGLDVPVLHYSEVLDECIRDKRVAVERTASGRAAFHDPCYLGRINGIYDPPRRVIDALGFDRVELPRSREKSACCGAGGGKIWMEEDENVTERPAINRIREVLAQDGIDVLVVACPKDLGMFQDAVKTLGAEDRLRIADLGELVAEALAPAVSEARPTAAKDAQPKLVEARA